MGLEEQERYWVESRFRSSFALATWRSGRAGASIRTEAFGVKQRGSLIGTADGERGWAATVAGHRSLDNHVSLWIEGLHVDSRRGDRLRDGLGPRQRQNQLQLVLRGNW